MQQLTFTITTQEKNKVREKLVTVNNSSDTADMYLSYPTLKLERAYVDIQIKLDPNGRFKGVHIAQAKKMLL